jgi:hypothetical protein
LTSGKASTYAQHRKSPRFSRSAERVVRRGGSLCSHGRHAPTVLQREYAGRSRPITAEMIAVQLPCARTTQPLRLDGSRSAPTQARRSVPSPRRSLTNVCTCWYAAFAGLPRIHPARSRPPAPPCLTACVSRAPAGTDVPELERTGTHTNAQNRPESGESAARGVRLLSLQCAQEQSSTSLDRGAIHRAHLTHQSYSRQGR